MEKIICNACGKEILFKNEIAQEDYLHIVKRWGYFSKRDGETDEIILCEKCYKNWIDSLKIKTKTVNTVEMI